MKRLVSTFAITAAIVTLLGAVFAWSQYFRTPPIEALPLATDLVALASPTGRKLLAESDAVADYDALRANFTPQSRRAYCSVASAITTLNAAGATTTPLDERALFAAPALDMRPLKVSFIGMSLRELGNLLNAHGTRATVVPASDTNLDAFRDLARANLAREGDFLLINYERAHLGQEQSGHISPVAAYHASSDRLLILDVAAHKYPPVWAPLEKVWAAMRAPLNEDTIVTRGFVVVEPGPGRPNHIEEATADARR